MVKKMVAAATSFAAALLLLSALSAGQAFAASCPAGSVDAQASTAPPADQLPGAPPKGGGQSSANSAAMCFGKMFPNLPAFHYSEQAAADLAATMENPTPDPAGTDRGTADDNPNLPSEYTYLGQFIDHNLDFDETAQPEANVNPNTLTNFESFRFDLNNVFGGGPTQDPQLYAADGKHLLVSGTLGTSQADGFPSVTGNNGVFDLSRDPVTGVANIVEPRDDETQILSQISAAFIAFYNDFIDQGMSYAQARQETEWYYQEIVLTDVLPAFVGPGTINQYLKYNAQGKATINTPDFANANFTPIEFSVGAYRFGHSLVRNNYHINDILPTGPDYDNNVPIFDLSSFQFGDLSGGAPLQGPAADAAGNCEATDQSTQLCTQATDHQIQWKYFVPELDANPNDPGINFARATQTTVSPALFNLPSEAIAGCPDVADPVCNGTGDLMSRDLARGNFDGLGSGQAIAQALGCPVIPAASINPTNDAVFNTGTPLFYYVLAEAQRADATLGCVGKAIVAQTFIRVLKDTPNSILNANFTPDPALTPLAPESPKFSFGDLLVDAKLAPRFS